MDLNIMSLDEVKTGDIQEILQKLSSSQEGLASSAATERLRQFGYNEIKEKKVNPNLQISQLFLGADSLDD